MRVFLIVSLLYGYGVSIASPAAEQFESNWKNDLWDTMLLDAIDKSILPDSTPRGINFFTPKYNSYSRNERTQFWGHLMVLLAEKESSFNPNCSYEENFIDSTGTNVISRGFFQLSYDSATISYNCPDINKRDDLYIPAVNINCAVKIFSHWIKRDNVISGKTLKGSHRGVARYWSTLRQGNKKLHSIANNLKRFILPFGISFDDAGDEVEVNDINIESPWDNLDLQNVLVALLEQSRLIDIKLSNSRPYIGDYNLYDRQKRLEFWTKLMIWIGDNQTDDAFFGITPVIAKEYGVSFDGTKESAIEVAVKISEKLIVEDQKITGFSTVNGIQRWQGPSRMWPVLRDLKLVKEILNGLL